MYTRILNKEWLWHISSCRDWSPYENQIKSSFKLQNFKFHITEIQSKRDYILLSFLKPNLLKFEQREGIKLSTASTKLQIKINYGIYFIFSNKQKIVQIFLILLRNHLISILCTQKIICYTLLVSPGSPLYQLNTKKKWKNSIQVIFRQIFFGKILSKISYFLLI